MFLVIDREDAILNDDTFAWERDHALDDELIATADDEVWVFEDDNVTALGDVRFILQMRPADGQAIDYQAITSIEC